MEKASRGADDDQQSVSIDEWWAENKRKEESYNEETAETRMCKFIMRDFLTKVQPLFYQQAFHYFRNKKGCKLLLVELADRDDGNVRKAKVIKAPIEPHQCNLPYFGRVIEEHSAKFSSRATSLSIGSGLVLDGSGFLDAPRADCCPAFMAPPVPKDDSPVADEEQAKRAQREKCTNRPSNRAHRNQGDGHG